MRPRRILRRRMTGRTLRSRERFPRVEKMDHRARQHKVVRLAEVDSILAIIVFGGREIEGRSRSRHRTRELERVEHDVILAEILVLFEGGLQKPDNALALAGLEYVNECLHTGCVDAL